MRKSTLFISAGLTAFVLAILAGVVFAYQNPAVTTDLTAQAASVPTDAQTIAVPLANPTAAAAITPQEAAALAAQVLNMTDLYSVESAVLNGVEAYKVTFTSGTVALVGTDGSILSIAQPQPAVLAASAASTVLQPAPVTNGGGGGAGKATRHHESESEGHDD